MVETAEAEGGGEETRYTKSGDPISNYNPRKDKRDLHCPECGGPIRLKYPNNHYVVICEGKSNCGELISRSAADVVTTNTTDNSNSDSVMETKNMQTPDDANNEEENA